MGMDRHGHMGDHLVIDELVGLGEDHVAVQRHKAAEGRGLEDVDMRYSLSALNSCRSRRILSLTLSV